MNQLQREQLQMNQPKRNNLHWTNFFVKSAAVSAEICWVLNLVTLKYLMNLSSNSGDLFSVMFRDLDIAK